MDYRRYGDTIVQRIDRGEEVLAQIKAVAEKEKVAAAEVSALGAINAFTVGVYDTEKKEYYSKKFAGAFEIVSLTGTLGVKDGQCYPHIHMSAGGLDGQVYGGHLNEATVSATVEVVIRIFKGTLDRRYDDEIGLNLLDFSEGN